MGTVKWGILGAAKIAREQVIPAMKKSKNTELYAIASREISKAEDFCHKFSITKAYDDYNKLISDPNIDAVYIPLPNHLHVPFSINALKAGKHVLCEKPISITSDEIFELIEVQKETKKIVSEAFMVRFHPQWTETKKLIQDGEIGKLNAIQGLFNYFNTDPNNIRNDVRIGGGGILDIGVYPIVTSRFITDSEPDELISLVETDPNFETDILASAILKFGNVQMSFTCSTQSHLMQHMRFIGTKGRLELPVPFNPIADQESEIHLWKNVNHPSQNPKVIKIEKSDQYTNQVDQMNNSILNGTAFPYSLEDSLKNMKIIDSIFRSSNSRKWEIV